MSIPLRADAIWICCHPCFDPPEFTLYLVYCGLHVGTGSNCVLKVMVEGEGQHTGNVVEVQRGAEVGVDQGHHVMMAVSVGATVGTDMGEGWMMNQMC